MNNFSGIYGIRSISHPERVYIGSAINIRKRWWEHKRGLRKGSHHNIKMQRHYDCYGIDDLVFEVIIKCDIDNLVKMEQAFLNLCRPWFNILMVAESRLGMKHTEEARAKISMAGAGRFHSNESRDKIRMANTGHTCSSETRSKIGIANKGRLRTEEVRKTMSKNRTGHNNPNYGKHHSNKARTKMSENNGQNKLIINIETGVFYRSIVEAARSVGKYKQWLCRRLTGKTKNNTMFRYA
jgi:group I intron endonuclease